MKLRVPVLVLAAVTVIVGAVPGLAWDVDPTASEAELEALQRQLGAAVHFYPRHGAEALGVTGIDLYADLAASDEFDDSVEVSGALDDNPTGGILAIARVGARKGLPGRVTLGLTYAEILEAGVGMWGGELQWSMIDGGLVRPSVALRATAGRSGGSGTFDLENYGLDVFASKGLGPLNAYAGLGVVDSQGTFLRENGELFKAGETTIVYFVGAVLDLLIPRLVVSVEQGESLQAALRVGLGW